jgi:hypothetical protein
MSYTTMTSLKEDNQTALFESLNFASLKVVPGTSHIDAQESRRQPNRPMQTPQTMFPV